MNLLKSLSAAVATLPAIQSKALPAVVRGADLLSAGRFQFQYMNGQAVLYDNGTQSLIRQGYLNNSDLYSVVRYIVNKAIRANFYLYEIKDEKQASAYMTLKGEGATLESLQKAQVIKKKALEETSQPQIDALLAGPNPFQSMRDFAEEAISYYLLTGERFMQIVSGAYPVSQLYILPSTLMEVQSGPTFKSIGGYKYIPTQVQIDAKEIIYSRTFNPALTGNGEDLRGLSPLRALALSIQKSNEGKLSGLRQYQQSGPPGILSMLPAFEGGTELTEPQADQIKASIARSSSGSNNRGRIHVTGQKAEWTQLGLSPVDLDILTSSEYDLRDFCRAYGIDAKVMGDVGASTFNNMAEARKAAIVDAVIPAVLSLADDLNAAIAPFNEPGKPQYFIDADVSHFPELAEDLNALWMRLDSMPLPLNTKLEAMQFERVDNPLMDEVWMDNNKTPLSQFGAAPEAVVNDGSYA